jgi:hypothetical protein
LERLAIAANATQQAHGVGSFFTRLAATLVAAARSFIANAKSEELQRTNTERTLSAPMDHQMQDRSSNKFESHSKPGAHLDQPSLGSIRQRHAVHSSVE